MAKMLSKNVRDLHLQCSTIYLQSHEADVIYHLQLMHMKFIYNCSKIKLLLCILVINFSLTIHNLPRNLIKDVLVTWLLHCGMDYLVRLRPAIDVPKHHLPSLLFSLLFSTGQTAVKLSGAEAANRAQCTAPD